MKWFKYFGIGLATLVLAGVIGIKVTQRVSDGPIDFLQGGPFKTGELVDEPVSDWSFGVSKPTEFELVGFGTSRRAGYIVHDGIAYMTCDLGYMWNRFEGRLRMILNLIYIFKRWHLDAVEDGRAIVRLDGKLYPVMFTKVEDPALETALRANLEVLARKYIGGDLPPLPADGPRDIWFFRMDSRT